jgi:hypothetical protein
MARRSTKAQDKAVGALLFLGVVVGLPIYLIQKAGEAVGWPLLIGGAIALLAAILWYRSAQVRARREALFLKYGDEQIVERIMNRSYWQGQSAEQLHDSLGDPVHIDEKVLKEHSRQTWKYQRTGANRFALRITVENDRVIGWDDKQ